MANEKTCPECGGMGTVTEARAGFGPIGTGEYVEVRCLECDGEGTVEADDEEDNQ